VVEHLVRRVDASRAGSTVSQTGGAGPASARRICVLSGGPSEEAAASRVSAADVYEALVAVGSDVLWLDLSEDGRWTLEAGHPDGSPVIRPAGREPHQSWQKSLVALIDALDVELVFPVIHGEIGEDGQIQRLCESLLLPYVGCAPEATLTCYDKVAFKRAISAAGLPVAAYVDVRRDVYEIDSEAVAALVGRHLGYPCIVKPARAGSSLGLARVESGRTLDPAVAAGLRLSEVVMIEQLCAGVDVEIGVLGGASPVVGSPVEIEYEGDLYDFATKYRGDVRQWVPARIPRWLTARLVEAARAAFLATGCRGMARVDFLVDGSAGSFVVNETNTIPYLPESSSFASSLRHAAGLSYTTIVARLVQLASERDNP
jgi:D-alanine-D-alanine ligase